MRNHDAIKITIFFYALFLIPSCSKYEKVEDDLDFLKYEYFTCDVVRVADGESFFCQPPDMEIEKIRLIGISVPDEREIEAMKYCESILRRGTLVKIEPGKESNRGSGDIPAYVFVPGGKMLNVLLLEKGYAEPVLNEVNEKYRHLFVAAEKKEKTEETENEDKPPWLK
ncbi:MAG: thermonuclease family protein [Thermodesulfobacteriota bacterium]